MADINLSLATRTTLLQVQRARALIDATAQRMSSGLRDSAITNAGAYFDAHSLTDRAGYLLGIKDKISEAASKVGAAVTAIDSIISLVNQMRGLAVSVKGSTTPVPVTLIDADFIGGGDLGGFIYSDGVFGGVAPTIYADGNRDVAGNGNAGSLHVTLGGVDSVDITNMSGGWEQNFNLADTSSVTIAFDYMLDHAAGFEADEIVDALMSLDGGVPTVLASLTGDGNGGPDMTTGWQSFEVTVNLDAGSHTLALGAFLNKKTFSDEESDVFFDNVVVTAQSQATNTLREAAETQFDFLRTQIDNLVNDSTFLDVNLLKASPDSLTVKFNEAGTATLTVSGIASDVAALGISAVDSADSFATDAGIDTIIAQLDAALTTLRTTQSTLGGNNTLINIRLTFTENLSNTLEDGAAKLINTDLNAEAANLLALQIRHDLALGALGLSFDNGLAIFALLQLG